MGSRASWGSPRVGVQGAQLSSGAGGRAGTGGQGLREMFGGGGWGVFSGLEVTRWVQSGHRQLGQTKGPSSAGDGWGGEGASVGVKRVTPVEAQEGARGARSCRAGLGGSRRTAAQVEVTRGRRVGRGGGERSGLCVTGEKEGVSGISGYPGGLGVYTWSGGSPRCCMRTPWDLWGQRRAGGRCFPGSAGLSVQEAVKPVTGGDRGTVETGLCFAEAPEFLSGESSRCQGPGGSGLRMVGAGKVRIGDVGQKRCETRENAKAPAWLSAEPQTEGVWTGSLLRRHPPPTQVV